MLQPPFQIIASGIAPQGLSAGQRAPNCIGCTVIKGGGNVGEWIVDVNDPSATVSNCNIIAFPGGGSNITGGVGYGQSSQSVVNGLVRFDISSYRNDTSAAIDVECMFIVVKWPDAEEGS